MTKITPELARRVHKRAKELGGWGIYGIKAKITREFKISRPTLDGLLERYPEPPMRAYREYKDFYEIPQIVEFQKIAERKYFRYMLDFWLKLNRKNPMNWTAGDIATLHNHPDYKDPRIDQMKYDYLIGLRKFMKRFRRDLYDEESVEGGLLHTKGHKPPKGLKREWFLESSELWKFISVIKGDIEFLAEVLCQVKWGCRHSALRHKTLKVKNFDLIQKQITIIEPKTKKSWTKFLDDDLIMVLEQYVSMRDKKPDDQMFPKSLAWYNYRMKVYGMKAGLCTYKKVKYKTKKGKISYKLRFVSGTPMSSHLMRHTFAFICASNDVLLEETADLGGWEDINTLKDFYYYVPPEKLRKRYYSIDWSKPTPRDKMSLVKTRDEPPTEEELKTLEREPDSL